MGLASLTSAFSSMEANRMGLQVTGHNIANMNTEGYTRQQLTQKDSVYSYTYGTGGQILSIGTGVSVEQIRQVRDEFLDKQYHVEAGKHGFYSAKMQVINELETIFKDLDDKGFNNSLIDFKNSLNELSKAPDSLEARGAFVLNAVALVDKVDYAWDQMQNYQRDLNEQATQMVGRVNEIVDQIGFYNDEIALYENSGDNANDFRDQRNALVDELGSLIEIDVRTNPTGEITIYAERNILASPGFVNKMELVPVDGDPNFLKPIWQASGSDVFNLDENIGAEFDNDLGQLKGILKMRGNGVHNYTSTVAETESALIPKLQREFDILVNDIVTMVNDIVAPQSHSGGPKGLDGSQYTEVFTRKTMDRYDAGNTFIAEDSLNPSTLYSAGNIEVNEEIIKNYNKICLSATNEKGDNFIVEEIISEFSKERVTNDIATNAPTNYSDYYNEFVSRVALEGRKAKSHADNQQILINQVKEDRLRVSGVSMDEELSEMMRYQHAYSAAAKIVNVVDEMMDTLINRLIR